MKRSSKKSAAATKSKPRTKVPAKHAKSRAPKPHAVKASTRPAVRTKATRKAARAAVNKLPAKKPPVGVATFPSALALYVYGVTEIPSKSFAVTSEAVDGVSTVEPVSQGQYLCWASRVSRQEFAVELQQNMENLEWLAACSIRHQKVLSEIGAVTQVLPARFGTVFLTPETLLQDFKERLPRLREVFRRITDADEWGVKIFGTSQSKPAEAITATSGADYLRQKSAALQSASSARRDEEAATFGDELDQVSEASVPGGKASSGQPGLLWSASFLVKRSRKKQFDQILKRYAEQWAGTRRIDVSGPWPPYSFVSDGQ